MRRHIQIDILLKVVCSLANGSSIHTVSALLLQLIQASANGVTARVRKLRSSIIVMELSTPESKRLDTMEEEARICAEIAESAIKSARVVAGYLVQK